MQSNSKKLQNLRKGVRINEQFVLGAVTLTGLTRIGSNKMLVKDSNAEEAIFVWTLDKLYAFIPEADKKASKWIRFSKAEDFSSIEGGLAAFHTHGREFGGQMQQQLGTVQHSIGGVKWQFCDIARGGSKNAPDDNEGDVANGPTLAMRWIHLVSSTTLKGAKHVMLTMNEDGENVFSTEGDVPTNLWLDGNVIDPEELTIESE